MKTSPKKLRLNKKQTTRLLELSLHEDKETNHASSDTQKEQLLLDALRSKLPLDRALERSLLVLITSIAEELKSLSGASQGELLADPNTKTDILIKIKDYAKERDHAAQSETEREVALAVYYAAIASALVHHHTTISKHSYKSLLREQVFIPRWRFVGVTPHVHKYGNHKSYNAKVA